MANNQGVVSYFRLRWVRSTGLYLPIGCGCDDICSTRSFELAVLFLFDFGSQRMGTQLHHWMLLIFGRDDFLKRWLHLSGLRKFSASTDLCGGVLNEELQTEDHHKSLRCFLFDSQQMSGQRCHTVLFVLSAMVLAVLLSVARSHKISWQSGVWSRNFEPATNMQTCDVFISVPREYVYWPTRTMLRALRVVDTITSQLASSSPNKSMDF